jgi:heat shock protein HtpX
MTGALIFGLVFIFTKRPNHMFLSQVVSSVAIVEGFRQMNCAMSGYVWGYFGIISGSLVFLGVIQMVFDRHVKGLEISDARLMKKLSGDIGCQVFLFDTQKVRAFTHNRRIYLSVGLVELLEYEEILAVATHELYHVNHTPNRILANSLAVASMWLRSYRDDANADRFAADRAGVENLRSAFEKLGLKGARRRISRISA